MQFGCCDLLHYGEIVQTQFISALFQSLQDWNFHETRRLLSVHSGHFRGGCLGGGGGDWFLNNVCIYDNKQWAVGVLSDLCWNLRVFFPVGSLGTCKKVLGVQWRKRGVYQQVLNLRKGMGHPFVEPQLGVGDDGVLTGNFSQKAGIAISTDFFFIL